jgi:N-acetylmuramoyl-L-alanine amidase
MLKKTQCPLVIVECGYLSNVKESALLLKDDYQEKMAWGIHLAIMQFINDGGLNK